MRKRWGFESLYRHQNSPPLQRVEKRLLLDYMIFDNTEVVELADTTDSKPVASGLEGSIPSFGTIVNICRRGGMHTRKA